MGRVGFGRFCYGCGLTGFGGLIIGSGGGSFSDTGNCTGNSSNGCHHSCGNGELVVIAELVVIVVIVAVEW